MGPRPPPKSCSSSAPLDAAEKHPLSESCSSLPSLQLVARAHLQALGCVLWLVRPAALRRHILPGEEGPPEAGAVSCIGFNWKVLITDTRHLCTGHLSIWVARRAYKRDTNYSDVFYSRVWPEGWSKVRCALVLSSSLSLPHRRSGTSPRDSKIHGTIVHM